MQKLLITGVSGFVGQHLYEALQSDFEVFGISRRALDRPGCQAVDLLDSAAVDEFFAEHNFDKIIHLAAVLASRENLRDWSTFQQNLAMVHHLIQGLQLNPSGHLINFSSSSVYPNIDGTFDEESRIDPGANPDGLYGLAKFNAEMIFSTLLPERFLQTHLRVAYVHGPNMPEHRVHRIFRRDLREKGYLTLLGGGRRVMPQVSIEYLSKIVRKVARETIIGTFNVVEENVSLRELAQRALREHPDGRIEYREEGPKEQFFLNSRLSLT